MIIRGFIVTVLLITMNILSCAQQTAGRQGLADYLEYLAGIGFSEYETDDFSEEIASLEFRPVDINSRSEEEISRLFFLSPFQVKSILSYTARHGAIQSKYELGYIPGFDKTLAQLCSAYISISERRRNSTGGKITRVSTSLIHSDRDTLSYPGSCLKFSTRLSHKAGNVNLGLTLDKDRGEKLIDDNYKPEFISGHINYILPSGKGSLILGDYRVRFGQGLLIWHGYSPGASPLNSNLARGSSRIVPYLSSDENNFFRGLACSLKREKTFYNIYLSANRIDANFDQVNDSALIIRSLYESGIHNSPNSTAKKDNLTEYSAGLNISYRLKYLNLGWTLAGTMFSQDICPVPGTETLMDFRGTKNLVSSFDYAVSLSRLYLYGEAALTAGGRAAIIQGLRLIPAERVKLNILFGYTARGYNSFHGRAFGKETLNNFRKSLLANMELDLAPGLRIYTGLMHHSGLWYGYRSAEFPGSTAFMTRVVWQSGENITLKLSYRTREYQSDTNTDRGIDPGYLKTLSSSRFHLDLHPLESLRLSSRFELSSLRESGNSGYLAYQGLRIDSECFPISLISRFYTYSIDNYDTRIYSWEDDLLFNPSVPSFFGKGNRTYLVIDYHPDTFISARFKYAFTNFTKDNQRVKYNEYRLQIRLSLRGRKS